MFCRAEHRAVKMSYFTTAVCLTRHLSMVQPIKFWIKGDSSSFSSRLLRLLYRLIAVTLMQKFIDNFSFILYVSIVNQLSCALVVSIFDLGLTN